MRARRRKKPIDRQIRFATPVKLEYTTSEDVFFVVAVGRRQMKVVTVGGISFVMRRGGRDGLAFQSRRGAGKPCLWMARLEENTMTASQAPTAALSRSKSMVSVLRGVIVDVLVWGLGRGAANI